ncbi:tRNA (adenosine(37)-N6)-threonylcarbamoyltransferase complex ATPase subunit type 1 TsaE [Thalassotalea sp. HSM 43]|uniref:tRNA (adenosine(37)-N6)-threonylcarbamoyltransferase complex ATPase subunit type 1 TsaE n=1 Tax=Thalassotalea sp. HSM 43 TaxID=2552945 RepID=UPI00107FD87A|nr:tRNA (adenosine(37)-N6)-threonylcarbamoyltransferase complex ATPase subunit type 1 TsaE [Thalassotalea sp. HSM 43]QBY04653.1 tRNA (adenosine(37)-N6)-threonylcarbamoyltransferase complex ATPase subunit type 1 TsaE [Thalassotalea sp. HSM 43]
MALSLSKALRDEQQTVAFGATLAAALQTLDLQSLVVFLHGDLGAGKTTLTRGFVQAMGHNGNVKSPTYTLVEPYELPPWHIYHFDLYRLADPEELEYMGIRDYFLQKSCCFVEWSEKGAGLLPPEDLIIDLSYNGHERLINVTANTSVGELILKQLT